MQFPFKMISKPIRGEIKRATLGGSSVIYLGGDLMLVKVGEVLEFGKDIFCSRKGLWLTLFPFLSLLASCTWEW